MKELNIELRAKILDMALNLENNINTLIISSLTIENENRKAITNKSGNLSFKNKIDLLYDLDIFNKDEHKLFLLMMEYRNQFLHNIECSSFEKAFELLGNDKKNQLLKFLDDKKSDYYFSAYLNLQKHGIDILLKKHETLINITFQKKEILKKPNELILYLIDSIFNLYDELLTHYSEKEITGITDYAQQTKILIKILEKHMKNTFYSEKYNELSKYTKVDVEKLNKIFKNKY